MMKVVRKGSFVVKELRVERPTAVLRRYRRSESRNRICGDYVSQKETRPVGSGDIGEALVRRGSRAIVRGGGGGEPALVDAAPV
jgi:hypothetical protein